MRLFFTLNTDLWGSPRILKMAPSARVLKLMSVLFEKVMFHTVPATHATSVDSLKKAGKGLS